jgi:hypothetical protein
LDSTATVPTRPITRTTAPKSSPVIAAEETPLALYSLGDTHQPRSPEPPSQVTHFISF